MWMSSILSNEQNSLEVNEEDTESDTFWLSVKSLQQATDVRNLCRKVSAKSARVSSNSPDVSPNTSVSMECKPNTKINSSIAFSHSHR